MKTLTTSSRQNNLAKILPLLLSIVSLVVLALLSISLGRVSIPMKEIVEMISGKPVAATTLRVITQLRLPRLLGAIAVGAALSVSGSVYQSIFQNPLVSPDLLGVSSGACAGAAIAIIIGLSNYLITVFSFVAGIISVAICVGISTLTKRKSNLILIFAGVIVGRFMDSMVGIMKYFADAESQLGDIVNWQLGTLSKVTQNNVGIMLPIILVCLLITLLLRWRINLLSVGEKEAASLGVNVTFDRTILIILSTLLTATSVCFCGTISWVGLIIPHISRWLIGSDNRYSLPLSALLGSNFMVIADLIARAATDYELPLGVITGFCGAPIFAFILIKKSKGNEAL